MLKRLKMAVTVEVDSPGWIAEESGETGPRIYLTHSTSFSHMASSTREGEPEHEDEIRMWREGDSWVITDMETGVTTQGDTREEALEMLDEAVALHKGEIGREPTDEELRELGIDPDDNTTGNEEPPEFLR
jgi:predicted RNase H-like HicB family nuclease